MRRVIWATLFCLSLFVLGNAQQVSNAPLTNESVVQLVKAGFKEKTVIAIINSRATDFKLDPDDLIKLKRNSVSENIILAMLSSQMGSTFIVDEENWEDSAFFKGKDQGSNIFGSGGSSQSSTRTRSGEGGGQSDGNVSGSASVRIIKPPVEGGAENAPAKLEKTPTLNNDGVIRMVEAGFSEGTIIKRIEQSPVDFDLSPGKLDELYKKRVTDAIVNAMRAAMGDK
ncbi:MAG TPA: hypothetical protein VJ656_07665 [Pyrinomonadaceae bacterium]|nr:hypothetical protein [Pyrinomonadaceae bacterium]